MTELDVGDRPLLTATRTRVSGGAVTDSCGLGGPEAHIADRPGSAGCIDSARLWASIEGWLGFRLPDGQGLVRAPQKAQAGLAPHWTKASRG